MNLEYILSLIFAGKNNSEPVRLQKPKSKTTVTEYINRFVERNFYLIVLLTILFLLTVFVLCCFAIVGMSATDSGMTYNQFTRVI